MMQEFSRHHWRSLHSSVCVSSASGQLVDFIKRVEQRAPLSCDTVLKIFYQTCRAVQHMHKQKPPVIHRDLKVSLSWTAQTSERCIGIL